MATNTKPQLQVLILDGPPELDLVFALLRGKYVSFTLDCFIPRHWFADGKTRLEVSISGLRLVEKNIWPSRQKWLIEGKMCNTPQVVTPNCVTHQLQSSSPPFSGQYDVKTRKGWLMLPPG